MRTPKNQYTNEEGHLVVVRSNKQIIHRELYPTYGKAMWAIDGYEKQYEDKYIIEYFDTRVFFNRVSVNNG